MSLQMTLKACRLRAEAADSQEVCEIVSLQDKSDFEQWLLDCRFLPVHALWRLHASCVLRAISSAVLQRACFFFLSFFSHLQWCWETSLCFCGRGSCESAGCVAALASVSPSPVAWQAATGCLCWKASADKASSERHWVDTSWLFKCRCMRMVIWAKT